VDQDLVSIGFVQIQGGGREKAAAEAAALSVSYVTCCAHDELKAEHGSYILSRGNNTQDVKNITEGFTMRSFLALPLIVSRSLFWMIK
jgi:hypothetical protein